MKMQKLAIRFNTETVNQILETLSNEKVTKSELARHALAFGLANLVVARQSMTDSEFIGFVANAGDLLEEVRTECK